MLKLELDICDLFLAFMPIYYWNQKAEIIPERRKA
jgi:hypothetical protein